ncbi:MAG TPA: thioredoxin [Phycisphaerae bacterium]|nr:thioredoxin [Phycisphaerae bacterium]
MAGANTLQFTQDNFDQEVLQADVPVLVDFWAEWCKPCLAMAPTIDELADEYAGKVKVGKVDTDSNRQLAAKFSISAIPTIILFNGGQPAKKFVGLTGKKDFKQALDEALQ